MRKEKHPSPGPGKGVRPSTRSSSEGSLHSPLLEAEAAGGPAPLFHQIKRYVIARIESGEWPSSGRLPSENELVDQLGVSRMTVHRALRELTAEGYLVRVQGVGTFVASTKTQLALFEVRPISDDIKERGGRHDSDIHLLARTAAPPDIAEALDLPQGAPVFHSIIVHREDDRPIQVEDRYVNPALAPEYLKQDFTTITPSHYLFRMSRLTEAEHIIEAVLPDREIQRLLQIPPDEPCLVVHRRTWSHHLVASKARLVHPGSRYQMGSRFKPVSSVKPIVA
jgi:GntR family histidine utilization transcriptional repressor